MRAEVGSKLLSSVRKCQICKDRLPFAPKPVLQFSSSAKILITGQAPGVRAHESGIPWNDASGIRLRDWLGISEQSFYDSRVVALVPMGFCYPGKGSSGDLPPRPECAEKWMDLIIEYLKKVEIHIVIGSYAMARFFPDSEEGLTELIKKYDPKSKTLLLPHPSPRNNIWLKKNAWFSKTILPQIKGCVQRLLGN